MSNITFEQWQQEQMKEMGFANEVDKQEPEYQHAREMILLRWIAKMTIEAWGCSDLWVDGRFGAHYLSSAHDHALIWKEQYSTQKRDDWPVKEGVGVAS